MNQIDRSRSNAAHRRYEYTNEPRRARRIEADKSPKVIDPNKRVRRNSDGDIVEFSTSRHTPVRKKETGLTKFQKNVVKGVAGISAAAMIAVGAHQCAESLTPPSANFNAFNHTVVEVSDYTSVDTRAIILANSIKNADEVLGEIILPSQYTMYGDKISELQEKLENDKLSDSKREKLQAELDELIKMQEEQDELATVYVDDEQKYAYILPNERGIYAETIKEAFGIKDGVIKSWNNLDFSWGTDGPEDMPGHYRDYTYSTIPLSGIKVPFNALGKTN